MWQFLVFGGISLLTNAKAAYDKGEINEQEYQDAVRAANEYERELKKLRPDETWQDIKPELLQKAAEYVPDIAAFVEENAPQLITEAGAGAQKRIQRQALQKYAAQAETGRDIISEGQREQALFEADARAKQRQQMLMQRMKQQGLVGSGAALAAQLQGEQAERQAARQESIRGTQEAEMRRRQALGEAAQLAGQMRQADLNVESSNVQTMNAFNQRLANARNIYNRYASGARNEAQLENQRRQAAVEQANINLRNKYAMYNREGAMAAKERAREFDVNALNKMYGVRSGLRGQQYDNQRQSVTDWANAITGAVGTGLTAYGAFNAPAATAAKEVTKGVASGLSSSLTDSGGPSDLTMDNNPPSSATADVYTNTPSVMSGRSALSDEVDYGPQGRWQDYPQTSGIPTRQVYPNDSIFFNLDKAVNKNMPQAPIPDIPYYPGPWRPNRS